MDKARSPDTTAINKSEVSVYDILWHPRRFFEHFDEFDTKENIIFLAGVYGIAETVGRMIDKNAGDQENFPIIFVTGIIFGALLGWLKPALQAILYAWSGKWLGGRAPWKKIMSIFLFAYFPFIIFSIPLLILVIGIWGIDPFQEFSLFYDSWYGLAYGAITILATIWSTVILVIGVSEIQKFSILRSISSLMLPVIIVAILGIGAYLLYKFL